MKNKLRSRWPLLFSFALVILFISYYFYIQSASPSIRNSFIMTYGILGIVSMVFLALYIVRKNIFCFRLGPAQSWLQAHIYIGIISLVIILMHSGFNFTGIFSIVFLVLFILVIASGIVGTLIYKTIPLSLTKYGRDIKPENETITDMEKHLSEADQLVSRTSDEFREIYKKTIRPFLKSKRTSWEYLFMEESELIRKRKDMMENCKHLVPAGDIYDINILSSMLLEREKLSFVWSKKKLLKIWLNFHLPLSTAMITMSLIHILAISYY